MKGTSMSKPVVPQPVVVSTVCSLCDEPWEAHGDNPTTLDCIRLLKAERVRTFPVYPIYQNGYLCATCGQWVYGNGPHYCSWQVTCGTSTSNTVAVVGSYARTS